MALNTATIVAANRTAVTTTVRATVMPTLRAAFESSYASTVIDTHVWTSVATVIKANQSTIRDSVPSAFWTAIVVAIDIANTAALG